MVPQHAVHRIARSSEEPAYSRNAALYEGNLEAEALNASARVCAAIRGLACLRQVVRASSCRWEKKGGPVGTAFWLQCGG
jgi:hypothetical protein